MDLRETLRPRVTRGAALLDSTEPYWWKRIEEDLDLMDCKRCVLGQVYGRYTHGLVRLLHLMDGWDGGDNGASHGFAATATDSTSGAFWYALDDLWLEAIAERKAR